jgi:hypothetical protein
MHIAPIGSKIEDWVSDDLSRPMVGDVSAPARLMDLDAKGGQLFRSRQNVTTATVATNAKREDVRVFDEQENIAYSTALPIVDQRSLKGKRISIGNHPKPTHLEGFGHKLTPRRARGRNSRASVSPST